MMTIEKLENERQYLKDQLDQIREKLKKLPQGYLRIERNGSYHKWFWVTKPKGQNISHQEYLKKDQHDFVAALALKTYYLQQGTDIRERISEIEREINYYKARSRKSRSAYQLLLENSEFRRLIPLDRLSLEDELAAWQAAPYPRNASHPEELLIDMPDGTKCRSKSERTIAEELIRYKIPYRYECELVLGFKVIHPDFTLRNRRTGEFFILEHFGKMTDELYFKRFTARMKDYLAFGYVPGVNLLATYETDACPLNRLQIQNLIETYLI